MRISNIILLASIFFLSPVCLEESISNERTNKQKELEIRKNINKADLSKLEIVDFKWSTKAMGTLGKFEKIEIKNLSIIGFKNITLEIQIYNSAGTLITFLVPIGDSIQPGATKLIKDIKTPMLPFDPVKTQIAIKSADIMYDSEAFSFKAKEAIKIQEFQFIVDDSSTKTIIVNKLEITNNSKNYYQNIEFILNFKHRNKIVASRSFITKELIGPGESKIFENFNVPALPTKQFESMSIEVGSGKMIFPKEYLLTGGDEDYIDVTGDIDIDDASVPRSDLRIDRFSWVNDAKHSVGTINIEITNNSRFKYNEIEIYVNYKTTRGNLLTRDKVIIKDYIDPYSKKTFSDVKVGYIQYETENVNVSLENANMIGSIKPVNQSRQHLKKKEYKKKIKKNVPKEVFVPKRELIIVDYDIKNYGSIKIYNRSDFPVSDINVVVQLFNENKLIKEYELTIEDEINPRQEKTFRALDLKGVDNINFSYVNILIKEAKRPLTEN
tara:strand:- start:2567 stop:4057 length:1491 start_codon:yes stop_codon:yes gene_type:complete